MAVRRSVGLLLGVTMAFPAWAQPQSPSGLLLMGRASGWGWNCPQQSAVLQEFNQAGIPLTVVDPAGWANEDFFDYTMIFLEDCQNNATYNAWNARLADLDAWVNAGGFLGVHATRACGDWASVQADIPGGTPTRIEDYPSNGTVLAPNHPVMQGVPNPASGNALAHDSYPNTGNASDTILLTAVGTNNAILFERIHGHGAIVYGGLTYSHRQLQCGGGGPGDGGTIMKNEVAYGATFNLCGTTDADGDGVGDDCDVCPGFDDKRDGDKDGVPDDCDLCPTLPEPSDLNHNGICDNLDDSDDDGVVDIYDVCPGFDDKRDLDKDGIPDDCDNCPTNPDIDQYDGDGDGFGLPCDCDDQNPAVNPNADEYCNGIDDDCDGIVDGYRSLDARTYWVDADGDGHGDVFSPSVNACAQPAGYVSRAGDCNDGDVTIHPDAPEKCDDIDQNCDGDPLVEGCPVEEVTSGGCATVPSGVGGLGLAFAVLVARRRRRPN